MATLQKRGQKDERRAVSHNPQTVPLPYRTAADPHAPWVPPPQTHARSTSAHVSSPPMLSPLTPPSDVFREPIGGSSSATSSPITSSPITGSRPPTGGSSQPSSPHRLVPAHTETLAVPANPSSSVARSQSPSKKDRRRSWFGGGGGAKLSKGSKNVQEEKPAPAWIIGTPNRRPYDLRPLLGAQMVSELWNEHGNAYIYLFPRTSGFGPSFRVDSSLFSSSVILTEQAYGRVYGVPGEGMTTASLSQARQRQMSSDYARVGSRTSSPSPAYRNSNSPHPMEEPIHLYLPISLSANGSAHGSQKPSLTENDVDTLVSARNFFSFLHGGSIVGTERRHTPFDIFDKISEFLYMYKFTNLDGSTYGEIAHSSFDAYVDELHIADVRGSRERTIEAIILGERMRSVILYNEAFVHGVGQWDALVDYHHPKFDLISRATKVRMERAALDLQQRRRNIERKLNEFEFPGMFAGIMNSKTADESKTVRFGVWRESFQDMRKWFMQYYRHKYGAWPPKASSKKNTLETNGLNRLVLRELYHDLGDLYDLLVDRTLLTTRTTDTVLEDDDSEDATGPLHRALRKVLSEYDRSTPPVQPPIPFDVPIVPCLPLTSSKAADVKARMKKLKKEALYNVLRASYNEDAYGRKTPFLEAFKEFEFASAANNTISRIADVRQGQWLFLYAVIQSLPMLVIDAPALRWTKGVEYFLCMPPRSGVPWARAESERTYYAVAGTVVSLPSDVVQFGIEGIYRRSHCWEMAQRWSGSHPLMAAAIDESLRGAAASPDMLPPPPPGGGGAGQFGQRRSRSASPALRNSANRASVMLTGLEALPMPPGVFADPAGGGVRVPSRSASPAPLLPGGGGGGSVSRPESQVDSSKTFDAILGGLEKASAPVQGRKGRRK